ncbi:NADH-quinone oxidoreductase subunit C [Thermomonas carbonis]|uniref:NADH-quinone oxidoreductase subunit C n=1 Tax=Thermomonas carbonis TaxID=1463158 RepID=A0A7G9SPE3_9GAMM|nr:NADH-quinone oxidoreductase subunit C [Thermomonas carbonis]QNN69718.1 NADH-quinone oxidoreductase subunit C [Thermomonas carbonis]GHB95059.1 NADH-quinone oxidoreductase subunit C [Thermomonas carbonis]
MSATFATELAARFGAAAVQIALPRGEVTLEVAVDEWLAACTSLRDEFGFDTFIDLCGIDYLSYGDDEWDTDGVSAQGFSRGVEGQGPGRFKWTEQPSHQVADPQAIAIDALDGKRYAAVLHLVSVRNNIRVRVRCFAADNSLPVVPSLVGIWPGVNWFEREAFDMFGIIFDGHPDLRRILTDYGFVGHPFRKDFPLIGNVEVHYDAEKQRVVYAPVTSVEPRVGVPRVIRDDARFATAEGERGGKILQREAR